MMISMKNLLGQRGSMMVEALAMLGLISMVTPMLYKKAAERTTELADINAASAVRTLSAAMETYIAANKSKIDLLNLSDGGKTSIPIEEPEDELPAFADYLPEGYMTQSGRIFREYYVAIRAKVDADNKKSYTGMVALPTHLDPDKDKIRIAKIASMVGGNGGVVDTKYENDVIGVQGLWETSSDKFFDDTLENGTIVAATVSAVGAGGSGGGIGADENALYRTDAGGDEKNTMQVALRMNSNAILGVQDLYSAADKINIRKDDGTGESPLESNDGLLNVWGKVNIGELLAEGAAKITGALTIGEDGNEVLTADDNDGVKINRDLVTKGNVTVGENNDNDRQNTFMVQTKSIGLDAADSMDIKTAEELNLTADKSIKLTGGSNGNRQMLVDNNGVKIINSDEGGGVLNVGDILHVNKNDFGELYPGKSYTGNVVYVQDGAAFSMYNKFAVSDAVEALVPAQFHDDVMMRNSVIMSADGTFGGGASEGDLYAYMKNIVLRSSQSLNWYSDDGITIKAGMQDGNAGVLDLRGNEVNITAARTTSLGGKDVVIAATEGNVDIDTDSAGETAINIGEHADYINLKSDNTNVGGDASNPVLYVGSSNPDRTDHDGTVYIRRGVVEVASTRGNTIVNQTGSYVLADRLISESPEGETGGVPDLYGVEYYDYYQVNPAYTSVMHDIKLTTRGGARLSDVLPDFITKGIFVLDNTYKEDYNRTSNDWNNYVEYTPVGGQGGKSSVKIKATVIDAVAGDPTIPWLGFIPAPQCPPGYGKVVTLNPIRWRMAEMYRVNDKIGSMGHDNFDWMEESHFPARFPQDVDYSNFSGTVNGTSVHFTGDLKFGGTKDDENNYVVNEDALPPTFQTNTWLNTTVAAGKDASENFYGWHAIMGFLYYLPEWSDYLKGVSAWNSGWSEAYVVDKFAWNMFPVRKSELMAIGHTYCYFDKRNSDANIVDNDTPEFSTNGRTIGNIRIQDTSTGESGKDANYLQRLNEEDYRLSDW